MAKIWKATRKVGVYLVHKVKGLSFSSGPRATYVKDLRKVMTYQDGRKCQYPENYDEIVESGKIIKEKDNEGNLVYKLLYGEKDKSEKCSKFDLALVKEAGDISYFTLRLLVSKERRDFKHYSGFYKPFNFSRIDLEKHVPVFEVQKIDNPEDQSLTSSYRLTNSPVLAKKGSQPNEKGEIDEKDKDPKGRNGKLLYTSDYKKLNISFSEIRDQNSNIEWDKSLISVPIVLAASLAKVFANWLTYLPMKLGEYLLSKQNPVAKLVGGALFIPAVAVKNLVNIGSTILKAPILLFVANKEKYGDTYFTMWKYQLKECWEEAKNDFKAIKDGKRESEQKEKRPNLQITATWDELNAMKPRIEKDLEKQRNSSGAGTGEVVEQKQQKAIGEDKIRILSEGAVNAGRVQDRRNSLTGSGIAH